MVSEPSAEKPIYSNEAFINDQTIPPLNYHKKENHTLFFPKAFNSAQKKINKLDVE